MLSLLGVALLLLNNSIANNSAHAARQHNSATMVPYVAPEDPQNGAYAGVVIIDKSPGKGETPFVEVYGGNAYYYQDSKDYHQNDLTRRQEALQMQTANQPGAFDIIHNF